MKKKLLLILNIIVKILLFLILFILFLAEASCKWFLSTFGEMDFSIVVYQLFSPMEGTSAGILNDYIAACLYPSVARTVAVFLVYVFWEVVTRKICIDIGIRLFKKSWKLHVSHKGGRVIKHVGISICMIALLIGLSNKMITMGVPAYLEEVSQDSTLFEDYYVDPDNVAVDFPERKRNLLLIYMESMEATYASTDATFGGRRAFYDQHGDYMILDYAKAIENEIIPSDYLEYWGMEDEKLYSFAKQQLSNIAQEGKPFNFTMLTVDTHHPVGYACSLCQDQYGDQFANAISCASRQVYEFIMWCQEQEWYEDTTIIITGDHLSMNNTFWDDIGDYERNVYNCFINVPEGIYPVQSKNREFSALDLFPTILASLDTRIEGDRLGLGTNLFSDEPTLPEMLGREKFEKELKLYSKYYFVNFVIE